MSLRFIAGSSGSGKSYRVFNEIINRSLSDPEERFFFMVPDQYTMQTQKELVRLHPAHSIMNIDVLSFNRLASRVFDETGFDAGTILEDMGKTLLLQKVIWDRKQSLPVLSKTLERPGGIDKMKSLVSELMQYRVTPGELKEYSEEEDLSPLLSAKLSEAGMIYQALKEKIAGKYLAAEEVCEALSAVLPESKLLDGSTVVFDGFTGFVPTQMPVVREILKKAKEVIVVITADEKAGLFRKSSPANLFHMSHEMAAGLIRIAEEEHIEVSGPEFCDPGKGRFRNSGAIVFLEKELFRYTGRKFDKDQNDIRVIRAEDADGEVAAAAALIRNLVRTRGYKYRDFAVICSDIRLYGGKMRKHMDDCGIPWFLDEKQPVLANPCVSFLRGAAAMIDEDFSYDSVFTYLRSGLSGLSGDEIDRMENYVLAAGIRGFRKYDAIWTKTPKKMDAACLEGLNTLRLRFMEELSGVTEVFKTRMSSVGEKTRALYELCVRCGIQQKLKDMETAFKISGEKLKEKEYAGIYKAVMDLFDKTVSILGEEKIGAASYRRLLETGFSQLRIGMIPTGPDEVFIGDIERSRVKNVKVLIFTGLNDGLVPRRSKDAGLINENDREILGMKGLTLSPSSTEEMFRQRFYLYSDLTLASDKIFLTFRKTDEQFSGVLPSYLIGEVMRMFPKLTIEDTDSDALAPLWLETAPGRSAALLEQMKKISSEEERNRFLELFCRVRNGGGETNTADCILKGMSVRNTPADIGPELAGKIYEDRYSVTRLQLFAGCAFAHFCRYGLKLNERETGEFRASDTGSIFHDVLRNFFVIAEEKGGAAALSPEERIRITDMALDRTIGNFPDTAVLESSRGRAQLESMRRILQVTTEALVRQLAAGEFTVAGIEKEYRFGKLYGTIDRYDICRVGDTAYVRVIDYKSGQTSIDYTRMFHGLQIQLPVYLNAALDIEGRTSEARAAGLYYLTVAAPFVDVDSVSAPVSYEDFLKKMRFDGLTLDERDIIDKMDGNAERSTVIPVRLKKDGGFYKGTPVVSEGDFRLIERYTKKLAEDLEEAIQKGRAAIEPAVSDNVSEGACEYCEYRAVCGFDERIPGFRKKQLKNYTRKNICAAMSEALAER